jgi:SpoVK/Ycf46/Vps4 family AAA+-type ATPase
LRRLDGLLLGAVEEARVAFGPEAASDPYRGLHVRVDDAQRLLTREPGAPFLWPGSDTTDADPGPTWRSFAEHFELTPFDLDVVLIALAPEVDPRYDRLYAFLQDDITRRRPTVDLALGLLCATPEARLEQRTRFSPQAPLARYGILDLFADPNHVEPSLLIHYLKLDEQIVSLLLGQMTLDRHLAPVAELTRPTETLERLSIDPAIRQQLADLVDTPRAPKRPLRLAFQGPSGSNRRRAAEALASSLDLAFLSVDLARALDDVREPERLMQRIFREAALHKALLYLDGVDELASAARARGLRPLINNLASSEGVTILAGSQAWPPLPPPCEECSLGLLTFTFTLPDFEGRRLAWESSLTAEDCAPLEPADLDALATRFRLTPGQIRESVAVAAGMTGQAQLPDLMAAARTQTGHELASLTVKIEPTYRWSDLVLPDDSLGQLHELCQRVTLRQRVLQDWGFIDRLSLGTGLNALFAGPSGTGKTMAAEIVAGELGIDLYRIELAGVVSKYIGETEKNLDRIFDAAESSNAILFFDEADALFGKRSEVHDSHDRYANIEISYLLQKMEQYSGIAILATNLRANLDEAFTRRMAFTVHFPFPDEASRLRIWIQIWPSKTPLALDLDLEYLARQFPLSGGNIRNIALAAAFLAADEDTEVRMHHVFQAVRREYQKMGKQLLDAELWGTYHQTTPHTGSRQA